MADRELVPIDLNTAYLLTMVASLRELADGHKSEFDNELLLDAADLIEEMAKGYGAKGNV